MLLHTWIPLNVIDPLTFDVALHWGTLFALVLYFRRDIVAILRGWFRSMRRDSGSQNADGRLAWLLIAGTVVPVLVGATVGDWIEEHTRHPSVVISMLLAGSVLLYLADRFGKRTKSLHETTVFDAVLIGASQVIAFLPGMSRSGITIITALSRNMKRESAVRFSFLLSIPVILAAGAKGLLDVASTSIPSSDLVALLVGVLVAAAFGYVVIRFLLRYVEHHSFLPFVIYRIAIAVVAFIILY